MPQTWHRFSRDGMGERDKSSNSLKMETFGRVIKSRDVNDYWLNRPSDFKSLVDFEILVDYQKHGRPQRLRDFFKTRWKTHIVDRRRNWFLIVDGFKSKW